MTFPTHGYRRGNNFRPMTLHSAEHSKYLGFESIYLTGALQTQKPDKAGTNTLPMMLISMLLLLCVCTLSVLFHIVATGFEMDILWQWSVKWVCEMAKRRKVVARLLNNVSGKSVPPWTWEQHIVVDRGGPVSKRGSKNVFWCKWVFFWHILECFWYILGFFCTKMGMIW